MKMDIRKVVKLNVHVEKETICGCTCTQYTPGPNIHLMQDGTMQRDKHRDQQLMCLGPREVFLLKYKKGDVMTNICTDNGVSKVSLDIRLNGISTDTVRYNRKTRNFHEIWVQRAQGINHCTVLKFDQDKDFDEFEKQLLSILAELEEKTRPSDFEYRLVAFKPLNEAKLRVNESHHLEEKTTNTKDRSAPIILSDPPRTSKMSRSSKEGENNQQKKQISNSQAAAQSNEEQPVPQAKPSSQSENLNIPDPETEEQQEHESAIPSPFSLAPFTSPSDVLTIFKNKMIVRSNERFTFDSSQLVTMKNQETKETKPRKTYKSDGDRFFLQKMPSLDSLRRECNRQPPDTEPFAGSIYTPMASNENKDIDYVRETSGKDDACGPKGSTEGKDDGNETSGGKQEYRDSGAQCVKIISDETEGNVYDLEATVYIAMNMDTDKNTTEDVDLPMPKITGNLDETVFMPMSPAPIKIKDDCETDKSNGSGLDTTQYIPIADRPNNFEHQDHLGQIGALQNAINSGNETDAKMYAATLARSGVKVKISFAGS